MKIRLWYPALIDVDDAFVRLVNFHHFLSIKAAKYLIALRVTLEWYPFDFAIGEAKLILHDAKSSGFRY